MQPKFRIHQSNGQQQWLTSRPHQQAWSNGIWNGSQHRKEHDHDQRHKNIDVDISMNSRKLQEVTSVKYVGVILCKDGYMLCRNPRQDCCSNGEIEQGLVK